jgi:hypothetical protein
MFSSPSEIREPTIAQDGGEVHYFGGLNDARQYASVVRKLTKVVPDQQADIQRDGRRVYLIVVPSSAAVSSERVMPTAPRSASLVRMGGRMGGRSGSITGGFSFGAKKKSALGGGSMTRIRFKRI